MNFEVKSGKLIVTIDLNGQRTPSASGKSLIVASTHGFTRIGNDLSLSLNLTAPLAVAAAKS